MFRKKAQAALEFLTTYGWAFLVILVMIGALSYFGVLDPSRYAPDSCRLSGVLECKGAFAVANTGTESSLQIQIVNNANKGITVTNATISEKKDNINYYAKSVGNGTISSNDKEDVTLTFDNALTSEIINEKKVFNLDILYTLQGSSIESIVQGTVTTTVQEGAPAVTCAGAGGYKDSSGDCWFGGELGESCTDVCGAKPSDGSWACNNGFNDLGCNVCMNQFSGDMCALVSKPAIYEPCFEDKPVGRICYAGGSANCVSSNALVQRLCVCVQI